MMTTQTTIDRSIEGYVVYHSSDAGIPEAHESGWYFEPEGYVEGEPFSPAYPTREAALDAAHTWQQENDMEEGDDAP